MKDRFANVGSPLPCGNFRASTPEVGKTVSQVLLASSKACAKATTPWAQTEEALGTDTQIVTI